MLRLSHSQTAFTATILLMVSAVLSRLIGLVRDKIIAYLFGAGVETDAYFAAFRLPELINYFLVGGAASVSFVTMLSRYRDQGREREGEEALSAILNVMALVLSLGILAGEFFAEPYIRLLNPGFTAAQVTLATRMTRIILPGQLFFFLGGVLGAVQLVRKQFAYQAITPILYNLAIIAGGLLLAHWMGISSLAVGVLAGAFLGSFLLNATAAWRSGVRWHAIFDLKHEGLRTWLRLSLPLMLGFTLLFLDDYILGYYASHGAGEISRLNYAKRLFSAPMAILGQAAGAASLPFFATLWSKNKRYEFAVQVASSVERILCFALLVSAWMIGISQPLVDLIFRGGHFSPADVHATSLYFLVFTLSLGLWSAQAVYVRAFYAAGDTRTPMITGSCVTLIALPVYWGLYHLAGALGLAFASDFGILLQTAVLAILLHRRRMVSIASLSPVELGRAAAAALSGGVILALLTHLVHVHRRWLELAYLGGASLLWAVITIAVLRLLGSRLPGEVIARLRRRQA